MKKLLFFASAVAMLASCSKDLTEDWTPSSAVGKIKITAYNTMDEGDLATRTHLEETLKDGKVGYDYKWDNGDAFGVFAANAGDDTNAYFGYSGTENEFTGDFLPVAKEFYAYYPWDRDAKLVGDNSWEPGSNLEFVINAKQKYNRNHSSFAATEAPAVAYAKVDNLGDEPKFNFLGLAAYVHIYVTGKGTISSLKFKAEGSSIESTIGDYALNGTFTVDMSELPAIYEYNAENETRKYPAYKCEINPFGDGSQKEITLVFSSPVDLSLDEPKEFWFVVPAGINIIDGDKFNFYVNGAEEPSFSYTFKKVKTQTKSNTPIHIGKTNHLVYVEDGATLISTAKDLLWYLFFVNHGTATGFEKDHETFFNVTTSIFGDEYDEYELKPAILTQDIAFYDENGVAAEGVPTRKWEDEYQKLSVADKALYDWYVHPIANGSNAEYYINTIGETSAIDEKKDDIKYNCEAVSSFSIKGYGENGVTVSGLTIKGNGVFATECASNITLKNITVDASEVNKGAVEGQEMPVHFLYKTLIDGVSVGENCRLVVAEGTEGALIDAVTVSEVPATGLPKITLPTYDGTTKIAYAYSLNIDKSITWADYKDLGFVEKTITESGVVVTVAGPDEAISFINGDEEVKVAENATYYSVVDESTSYWTGTTADKFAVDNVINTAEELAYATAARATRENKEYTLGRNLNLMGKDSEGKDGQSWSISRSKYAFTLAGTKTANTIGNVLINARSLDMIDESAQDKNNRIFSLFGYDANISDLTVKDVTIDVPATAAVTNAVAGLAKSGVASNVTVDGLIVKVANGAKTEYAGGMFTEYTGEAPKNCEIKNASAEGVTFGEFAGNYLLEIKEKGNAEVNQFTFGLVKVENKLFGRLSASVKIENESTDASLTFDAKYKATVLPNPEEFKFTYPLSDKQMIYHFFDVNHGNENLFTYTNR